MQHESRPIREIIPQTSTGDIYQIRVRLSFLDSVDRALFDPYMYLFIYLLLIINTFDVKIHFQSSTLINIL